MIFTESCQWIVKCVQTICKNNSHLLNVIIICNKLFSTKTVLSFFEMKYRLVKVFKSFQNPVSGSYTHIQTLARYFCLRKIHNTIPAIMRPKEITSA